mmetsp:Transcript_34012/g.28731  ORF Transcript_34012/g.28731 Transcript_34012/m.28731 type:complete len:104 (+) Transcript_34012:342-653(+)
MGLSKTKASKFSIKNDDQEDRDEMDDNLSTSDISQTELNKVQNEIDNGNDNKDNNKQKSLKEIHQEIILKSKTWKIERSRLKYSDEKLKKEIDDKISNNVDEI